MRLAALLVVPVGLFYLTKWIDTQHQREVRETLYCWQSTVAPNQKNEKTEVTTRQN
jgi:hypothetical protein